MRSILCAILLAGCGAAQCPEPEVVETAPAPVAAAERPERNPTPPANPPSGSVRVRPSSVQPEGRGGFVLLLADETQQRVLPVMIGQSEAHIIDLRMRGETFERPLTHDLLSAMIERLGAEVLFVHVDKLESNIFVGSVVLWDGFELQTFDSRTSDAVAIGLGHDAPIYVSPAVFEAAGRTPSMP